MVQGDMMDATKLDNRLVRALREGQQALPSDLARLNGYMKLIGALLEEKAAELEPTWALALAAAAEVETLQDLETAVAGRACAVEACSIAGVLTKLAIWQALPSEEEPTETSLRDRLVLSVRSDLERLARDSVPVTGASAAV